MSSSAREQLLDYLPQAAEDEVALPAPLASQLKEEASLEGWWLRCVRQVRALDGLSRVPVPDDLDGRVVAATQGGYRQERVLEQLRALAPQTAPPKMAVAVRHELERPFQEVEHHAPAELDDRVAWDLAALPRAATGRGALDEAPKDLADLRPRRANTVLATALALVTLLGVGFLLRSSGIEAAGPDTDVASKTPSFEDITAFEYIEAAPNSSQAAAILAGLDAFAGGAYEGSRR